MEKDKAAGRTQTALSDMMGRHGSSAVLAPRRLGGSWWFVIGVIGLLLVLAVVTRLFWSEHRTLAVQDYVPIVSTHAGQTGHPAIYDYKGSTTPPSSAGSGVARVSSIDDSSSEAAYRRSCLAALTRDNNAEIMALSEAVREDMCTDPRRK